MMRALDWLAGPLTDPMKVLPLTCLTLGLLGAVGSMAASPRAWLTSLTDAEAEAKKGNRWILVDLYADWCGWCKVLESEVFSTPEFQEYTKDFVLLRVDTEDRGEGTRLQADYEVFSLPTTLILDHRLVKIGEVRGFAPVTPFIQRIKEEISVFHDLEKAYERFRQSSDARAIAVLAEEFHLRRDGNRASALYRHGLSLGHLSAEEEAVTRYQLADALRLARQFDDALAEVGAARARATGEQSSRLIERLDLLAAEIALDRGDCLQARTALEDFLGRHPKSDLTRQARRTLASLDAEGSRCT